MSLVLSEKKGNVCVITINRPEALNSLNADVLAALSEAFNNAEKDDDVLVIILTGAGRAFVAGADIAFMRNMSVVEGKLWADMANGVFLKIEHCVKPVIAAVNGFALGGGNELCMCCDIRIASDKAKFGQPEVGLGITPGFGGTQRLPRHVGLAKSKELIYTANMINAEEAKRIGLVSYVYPADQLMDEAMKLAGEIIKNAQEAVRQSKACINRGMQMDISTAVAYEGVAFGFCFGTEDQKLGMQAFLDKKKVEKWNNK